MRNLITKLSSQGVRTNVTAMMTVDQVKKVLPGLSKGVGDMFLYLQVE